MEVYSLNCKIPFSTEAGALSFKYGKPFLKQANCSFKRLSLIPFSSNCFLSSAVSIALYFKFNFDMIRPTGGFMSTKIVLSRNITVDAKKKRWINWHGRRLTMPGQTYSLPLTSGISNIACRKTSHDKISSTVSTYQRSFSLRCGIHTANCLRKQRKLSPLLYIGQKISRISPSENAPKPFRTVTIKIPLFIELNWLKKNQGLVPTWKKGSKEIKPTRQPEIDFTI